MRAERVQAVECVPSETQAAPPASVDVDPVWNRRLVELSCAINGVSLMMPAVEPYFIRSIRAVQASLEPTLVETTERFVAEEAHHHAEHRRFNALVRAHYPAVAPLERLMMRVYGHLGARRSIRFNVAFTAASEMIGLALARWVERRVPRLVDGADPAVTRLFMWHLAEEVEHKNVAFDVFEATDGSRRRYALTMLMSLALLGFFTSSATLVMLWRDRRLWNPLTYVRLLGLAVSATFDVLPDVVLSCLPGRHPSQVSDPTAYRSWLDTYDTP